MMHAGPPVPRYRFAVLLAARIGMASLFVFSGLEKLFDYSGAAAFASMFGVPFAQVMIAPAIALELGCAASLLTARYCRYGAAILIAWMLVLGPWFHPFWAVPAAQWQVTVDGFFHHFVMAGGLAYVVAFGAGNDDPA